MMQPINKIYLYVFSIWQGKILIYFMSLVVEYERITSLRDFHFTSDNHVYMYLIFIHTFFFERTCFVGDFEHRRHLRAFICLRFCDWTN